jgi:hypothetical protein
LVPRFSSTPVATWTWPTWVVSQRRVLEAVFVLLEYPSPSRRIFIGSHSLPHLWFAASVLHVVLEPVRVFSDSNQSKIQGWCTRNGVRVLHTLMARTTRCGVSGWQGSSAERVRSCGVSRWTQAMSSRWTFLLQDRGTCSTPTIRRLTTCFVLCVSLSTIGCTTSTWLVESGRCLRKLMLGMPSSGSDVCDLPERVRELHSSPR